MKKKLLVIIILILIITLLFLIISLIPKFGNTKSSREEILERSFKIYKNQIVNIKNENIKIELLSITDSRCPQDAQCIWAGEINYQLVVNDNRFSLGTARVRNYVFMNYDISLQDGSNLEYAILKVERKKEN